MRADPTLFSKTTFMVLRRSTAVKKNAGLLPYQPAHHGLRCALISQERIVFITKKAIRNVFRPLILQTCNEYYFTTTMRVVNIFFLLAPIDVDTPRILHNRPV